MITPLLLLGICIKCKSHSSQRWESSTEVTKKGVEEGGIRG
jgi:hypothetical protein